jgi:hypothetical protein
MLTGLWVVDRDLVHVYVRVCVGEKGYKWDNDDLSWDWLDWG